MLKVVWVVHGDGCCLEVGRVAIGPLATKQVISFHGLQQPYSWRDKVEACREVSVFLINNG